MSDLPKTLIRWGWGGMCIASVVAYSVEFAYSSTKSHIGFIALFLFVLVFALLGVAGAYLDHLMIALAFCVCWAIVVVCDAHYVGAHYAFIVGQIACSLGAMEAIGGGGGGGGGKVKRQNCCC